MALSRAVAVLVLVALVPVYPLAFATPIDPSYPGGFYDNADFDDVVEFLCGCAGTVPRVLAWSVEPVWIVLESIRADRGSRIVAWCSATGPRAPPGAASLAS